jgi:hypothetical protein
MAPPDEPETPQRRGMMAPDPEAAAKPPSLPAFLWAVACLLLVVELALNLLG